MARPATVLQVLPALVAGGVERSTVDIAAALVRAGCRALVVSAGGPMAHELSRAGAQSIIMPVDSKRPWVIRKNAARLAELIVSQQVDIIHARSRAPAWSAYLAAKRTGRPFVTTFHGTYNFKGGLKRYYNSIMARGDLVIANSEFIGRHILDNYKIDPDRIRVIPRGIDVAAFDPTRVTPERLIALSQTWRLPDGYPVIMLPARVTRWKGHAVLLQAIYRMNRRDLVCLFVGDDQGRDEYRREIEAMTESLGLGGVVRFVGPCRDMPAAYMLADVVVSASTDPEAFGRVAAEASAMERLIIATDHGGARETVLPGETGWLVPPGDPQALADALADALALEPARRAALGARGRQHIAAHFTREGMCGATLGVYDELLANWQGR